MLEILQKAGWVAWPLGLFSVLALAIMLERLVMLARLGSIEEQAYSGLLKQMDSGGDLKLEDASIENAPVTAVLRGVSPMKGASVESLQTAAEIGVSIQRVRLRRYLGVLATIGSVSPFIGLLGTVMGVLKSFQEMQNSGLGGERMAGGIGEALSATAIGLAVAIPSVMAYNFFTGRVQTMVLTIHQHVAHLIPSMERRPVAASREA